ncbi:GFA family protein [Castellaniella sp.]|uniref:GFA family protein n=1 Tax=Castellaniella sp. TaxID=1955812 RepID=UPI003C788C52
MSFQGQCHCGAVKFSVDAPLPTQAVSCNCSHCRAKGFLLAFFPAEKFSLTQGQDSLRSYRFNTHQIEHQFCAVCGTQAFALGALPDGTLSRAVNLRCVPQADLDALDLTRYDGANLR